MKVSKNFKVQKNEKEQLLYNVDLLLEKIDPDSENYKLAESIKLVIGNIPIDIKQTIEQKVMLKKLTAMKLEIETDKKMNFLVTLVYVLPDKKGD